MNKQKFIQKLQERIPARWHMSVICFLTIATGILVSKGILFFDLADPMIRYGIAVWSSYAVFFLLIYFWLMLYFGRRKPTHRESSLDAFDALDLVKIGPSPLHRETWQGHGGQFSGGGASGSWDSGSESSSRATEVSPKDVARVGGDVDETIVIVLLIAVLAAIFGSAGYVIYYAPEILFDAAFEVVLATALLRRAKNVQREGWKYAIFKHTWWLFAIVLFVSMAFGFIMKKECPEAASFAQFRALCWDK